MKTIEQDYRAFRANGYNARAALYRARLRAEARDYPWPTYTGYSAADRFREAEDVDGWLITLETGDREHPAMVYGEDCDLSEPENDRLHQIESVCVTVWSPDGDELGWACVGGLDTMVNDRGNDVTPDDWYSAAEFACEHGLLAEAIDMASEAVRTTRRYVA